jgi:hypothetical protein
MDDEERQRWIDAGVPGGSADKFYGYGFDLEETTEWRQAGFGAYSARHYRNVGIGPQEAIGWREAGIQSGEDAEKYVNAGFTLEQAGLWSLTGSHSWELIAFHAEGLSFEEALARRLRGDLPASVLSVEAKAIQDLGVHGGKANELARSGITASSLATYLSDGFTVEQTKILVRGSVRVETAEQLRSLGFAQDEAGVQEAVQILNDGVHEIGDFERFRTLGFTPDKAIRLMRGGSRAEDIEQLLRVGISKSLAMRLAGKGLSAAAVTAYRGLGIEPREAARLGLGGIDPAEFGALVTDGISHADAVAVITSGGSVEDLHQLRRDGHSLEEGTILLKAGMHPDAARICRAVGLAFEDYSDGVIPIGWAEVLAILCPVGSDELTSVVHSVIEANFVPTQILEQPLDPAILLPSDYIDTMSLLWMITLECAWRRTGREDPTGPANAAELGVVPDEWLDEDPYEVMEQICELSGNLLRCSNPSSMVSGEWDVRIFHLGEFGLISYDNPDTDTYLEIKRAWYPGRDDSAFRAAFFDFYTDWENLGLPPFLGEAATGPTDLMVEAIWLATEASPEAWAAWICPKIEETWPEFPSPEADGGEVDELQMFSTECLQVLAGLYGNWPPSSEEAAGASPEVKRELIGLFWSSLVEAWPPGW